MAPTRTIAGLMGPLIAGIGLSLVTGPARFAAMVDAMADDPGVIYLTGALMLLAGVAIVRVHNVWAPRWPVIVTVLGWLVIVGGLVRMLLTDRVAGIALIAADNPTLLAAAGVVGLALGGFLTFMSFRGRTE